MSWHYPTVCALPRLPRRPQVKQPACCSALPPPPPPANQSSSPSPCTPPILLLLAALPQAVGVRTGNPTAPPLFLVLLIGTPPGPSLPSLPGRHSSPCPEYTPGPHKRAHPTAVLTILCSARKASLYITRMHAQRCQGHCGRPFFPRPLFSPAPYLPWPFLLLFSPILPAMHFKQRQRVPPLPQPSSSCLLGPCRLRALQATGSGKLVCVERWLRCCHYACYAPSGPCNTPAHQHCMSTDNLALGNGAEEGEVHQKRRVLVLLSGTQLLMG